MRLINSCRHRWAMRAAAAIAACAAVTLGAVTPPPAGAATQFHVPWGAGENMRLLGHLYDNKGVPDGANNWQCRPSREHPNPVVLFAGTSANAALNFMWLAPLLANNGYCVYAQTYGTQNTSIAGRLGIPGSTDMRVAAAQDLKPFINKVLSTTGATQFDYIGHSQGTIIPRWYISKLGGAQKVGKSINLAPLWDGTTFHGLLTLQQQIARLWPGINDIIDFTQQSVRQFARGSDFMDEVNAHDPFPASIQFTNIMTRYDEAVTPYTSGKGPTAPNTTNIVLQDVCPRDFSEHIFLAADPNVGQLVLNALDPDHATPVQCTALPRSSN